MQDNILYNLTDEYVNFKIYKKLNNIQFLTAPQSKNKVFINILQPVIEEIILNTYKNNITPHNSYGEITCSIKENIIYPIFAKHEAYIECALHNLNEREKSKISRYTEFLQNNKRIRNFFISQINNKKEQYKQYYEDYNNYNVIDNYPISLTYRNLNIKYDQRLKDIRNKSDGNILMLIILRYLSYGLNGNHCSLPYDVYNFFYDKLNIRCEGFSSPFNSKLFNLEGTKFCTLFHDTDKYVGSIGPFSYKKIVQYQDNNWTINPPYFEDLMYFVYKNVKKALKLITREDIIILVLIPKHPNAKSYQKFSASKYLYKKIEPNDTDHVMSCLGELVNMKDIINSLFVLGKNIEKVKSIFTEEIENKLLKIWKNKTIKDIQESLISEKSIVIS